MISIHNLSFTYPGSLSPQLNHINLTIEKGEFIALIGENGCGKSTLCKAINGLIPHFFSGDYEGSVMVDSLCVEKVSISQLAQKVGYVYQDFENQIIRPTLIDDASFASMNYAYPDYIERGRQSLVKVGLGHRQQDYIWQLSGGQKHLLALASASALNPEIYVLDEPIAQLDPQHANDIYHLLEKLNQEEEKTVIVIEHHTEYIAQYCTHVVMMHEGRIVWKLPTKEALNRIEELQSKSIFPPQVTLAAKCYTEYRDTAEHHTAENYATEVYAEQNENLLPVTYEEGIIFFEKHLGDAIKNKRSHTPNIHKPSLHTQSRHTMSDIRSNKEKIVTLRNISLEYATVKGPKTKIFDELNIDLFKGENIGLIGNNGAGKTTLFKLLTGLIRASKGSIFVAGEETTRMSPEKIANHISMVYQNPEQMFISDSIEGDIMYAMKARKVEDYEKRGIELMEQFRLLDIRERDGRLLSGGQMRRASLAIGIALNPSILLLDEPTANLDIATRKEILTMLTSMQGRVNTAIIASHDMQLITEWADRILVLHNGKIIADGCREEIFGNHELMRLAGIDAPPIHRLSQHFDQESNCFTLEEFDDYFRWEGVI